MAKKVTKKTTTVVEETIEVVNNELTEVVAVLDRSGSMSSIIDDVVGGFNTFIEKQKNVEIPTKLTTCLFDDEFEMLYDDVDLKEVKKITKEEWSPRGTTALYDAIGRTINSVRKRHSKLKKKERPDKVLVVIVTDGYENASKEFTSESIKKLIGEMEEYEWEFIYLAANQNAFDTGTSFGIKGGNTFTYTANSTGSKVMFDSLSDATMTYRSATLSSSNYQDLKSNLFADKDEEK